MIEVAHTSQDYDLQGKAPLYAAYGVVEYWSVDTVASTVTVFPDPVDGRYRHSVEHPLSMTITPLDCMLPAINVVGCIDAG